MRDSGENVHNYMGYFVVLLAALTLESNELNE